MNNNNNVIIINLLLLLLLQTSAGLSCLFLLQTHSYLTHPAGHWHTGRIYRNTSA